MSSLHRVRSALMKDGTASSGAPKAMLSGETRFPTNPRSTSITEDKHYPLAETLFSTTAQVTKPLQKVSSESRC